MERIMKSKRFLFVTALIVLAGCSTPYELQPLSLNHPANAQAPSAPLPMSSKTLAYTRTDVPSAMAAAAPQGGDESHHPGNQTPQKTVVGEGKVIATVPGANQLVVEHGEIKDFMEPMTMGYRVEPSSLLEGLKAGDQIRFTVDVPKKTIVKVEKMK
jgi:Cu/Ag efflux protein CusF